MLGISLFLVFAAIAFIESRDTRILLLAPAAVLFTFHTALYGLEYDEWMKRTRKPPQTPERIQSVLC